MKSKQVNHLLKRYLKAGDNVKYLSLRIKYALYSNDIEQLEWILNKAEYEFHNTKYYFSLLLKGYLSLASFYRNKSKFDLEFLAYWKSRKYVLRREKTLINLVDSFDLLLKTISKSAVKRDIRLLFTCLELIEITLKCNISKKLKNKVNKKIRNANKGVESPISGKIETLLLNMYDDLDDDEVADKFAEILKDDIIISIIKDRREKKDEKEK